MILNSNIINKHVIQKENLEILLKITTQKTDLYIDKEKTLRLEIFAYSEIYGKYLVKSLFINLGLLPFSKVNKINIDNLTPGIYCIETIEIINTEDLNIIKPYYSIKFQTTPLLFQILKNNNSEKIDKNKMTEFQKNANKIIDTEINNSRASSKTYIGYTFCNNVYLGKSINIGECLIIPSKRMGNTHIRDYMYNFIEPTYGKCDYKSKEAPPSFDDPYKTPMIIIIYPRIISDSPNDAANLLHNKAISILQVLSLINDSYGSILGELIIKEKNNKYYTASERVYYNPYAGNLFVGNESSEKVLKILKEAGCNTIKKFYLNLFIECSKERRSQYSYFRYWNLLETIARNKNYIGKQKKDEEHQNLTNCKGKPILIKNQALDLVFELIRDTYEKINIIIEPGSNLKVSSFFDLLKIFYQRRNCIAHRGNCQFNNPTICDTTDNKKSLCRKALFEMKNKSNDPNNFTDEYLFELKNIVTTIIRYELNFY